MKHTWTLEKILALAPDRLEILRKNAVRLGDQDLADQCAEAQAARKPAAAKPRGRSLDPVVGFHFVCEADYEVTELPNKQFWSGVWVVNQSHCDTAIALKGYVALHTSKRELSYRQGTIVAWKLEQRTKGTKEIGVSFLLQPLKEPVSWHGSGSGEKGYRRSTDEPKWE